jgi:hypothetical protein
MTSAEHEEIKNGLVAGMRMMLVKMQDISTAKKEHGWTMCEVSQMADALKDVSEAYKNYAKSELLLSEHSSETY